MAAAGAGYIGSASGVALVITLATARPGRLAQGADSAFLVSAALCLLGALTVLALRERR